MPRWRLWRGALLAGGLALAAPVAAPVKAQEAAQLAADSIALEAGNRLVARGNVEMLHQGARLRAERVVYIRGMGRAPDRLELTGPVVLEDDGRVLILADGAALSADLREGVMRGARMVLDRRLQLAAAEINREAGRFTRLERVVTSSCQICSERDTPLWEIRAARVTHDAETRQMTFERAALRLGGRTVVVIPRLRLPDPTVRRATGFLVPELVSTGALGPGLRVPYFIALAPDRDLTLTPRLHARGSLTLGARYRQAFAAGDLVLDGAVTRDRLRPGDTRGFLAARADWRLSPDTALGLRLRASNDRRYLGDYGLGEADPQINTLFLEHARRDATGRLRLTSFRSFRDGVDNARLPNTVIEAGLARRVSVPGGHLGAAVDVLALARASNDPVAGAGRDLARISARLDWRGQVLLPGGVLAVGLAEVQADSWAIRQDDTLPARRDRLSPTVAAELRWPLIRATGSARHLLEPVAQLVWAPRSTALPPNEDSLLVEFDEATLFSLHRFPGWDAREGGARANLGLSWTRHDPAGWQTTLAVGRVLRSAPAQGFSQLSGLSGSRSAWLAAARMQAEALSLDGRALIDDGGHIRKGALRLELERGWGAIAGSWLQLDADAAEDRADRTTELGLDGRLALGDHWTAQADLRYDLARGEAGRAGLAAQFRNECLAVDVSLSRRFVSSTSVAAQTVFGLRVDLLGFGEAPAGPARRCR